MQNQLPTVFMLLMLSSCTAIHTYDAQLGYELNAQQKALPRWRMQGRLVIKSDEVLTANIDWNHEGKNDELRLSGALGAGAILIELSEREIMLDTGQGERQVSRNIDAFVANQIGFDVPITALKVWIIGDYLPDVGVLQLDNGFQQLGWQVRYLEYIDTEVGVMPRKIIISKANIKLKLIVDHWEVK